MSLSARNCVSCTTRVTVIRRALTDISFTGKDKKRVDKTVTQTKAEEEASKVIGPEELKAAMEKVKLEELPGSPDEREQYFMAQVSMGEQITAQGNCFCSASPLNA